MFRRLTALAGILIAGASFVGVCGAAADTGVLPPGLPLPWTDPNHQSSLEQLISQIASHITGRPVSVRCEGQNDWDILTQQRGIPAAETGGYVDGPLYWVSTRTFAGSADLAQLSPTVCLNLQNFAEATSKPTKCSATQARTTTVYKTVRLKVRVRVYAGRNWRRHGGHEFVTRLAWRSHRVAKTITSTVTEPPAPCFVGTPITQGTSIPGECRSSSCFAVLTNEPQSYWTAYDRYAQAIVTLAHESIHMQQLVDGASVDAVLPTSETDAECYGIQWAPYVAEQLGATPDDGQAIAKWSFDIDYPALQGVTHNNSPYWSADCHQDGPLDLTPGDGVWP